MGDRLEKAADLIMGCFRVCASDKLVFFHRCFNPHIFSNVMCIDKIRMHCIMII